MFAVEGERREEKKEKENERAVRRAKERKGKTTTKRSQGKRREKEKERTEEKGRERKRSITGLLQARTPQMNSIAERQVRSGKDAARTLLIHAGLPARFWWHAIRHATIVWNRTNVASTTGITPHEAMRKVKPDIKHFGVFGCDVYYHIHKEARDTFDAKMAAGIYLGHDLVHGCAIIYDMKTGKRITSRDVAVSRSSLHACCCVARWWVSIAAGPQRIGVHR